MDVSIIGNQSIKLKGKEAAFIVDPRREIAKTTADAIILLNNTDNIDVSRVTDYRLIINGAGGYEVGGVKISGITTSKGTLYKLSVDEVSIILGCSTDSKVEGFSGSQVAVINTNDDFNESFVTAMEPKITVLYGDKKEESAKKLGAENIALVPKITITKDKLPEKMEIVVLG